MFQIPQSTKEFVQDNSSDRKGNVHITKNINFDDKGYLKLSDRTRVLGDSSTMTDLGSGNAPVRVIEGYDYKLWAISDKNVYFTSDIGSAQELTSWTKDTATDFPTLSSIRESDMLKLDFNDGSGTGEVILITDGTSTVYQRDNSGYSELDFTEVAELLCVFESEQALAVSEDNIVRLFDLYSGELLPTVELVLPAALNVTTMAYSNSRLYIGTRDTLGGRAIIFEWDGSTATANAGYTTPANAIFSMDTYQNGVAFVDSNGDLWYCSGGIQKIDSFPRHINHKFEFLSNSITTRAIFHRGLVCDDDKIYISINAQRPTSGDNPPKYWSSDFPSGVWCYTPETKLQLKYTIGESRQETTDDIATSSVNTTTDVITVAGATVPETGTPCFYYASTPITELANSTKYYVIHVSDTTLKLATTYENAINGMNIDLTGTGSNTQYITFNPVSDFGSIYGRYGGIKMTNKTPELNGISSDANNEILIGGRIQSGTSTSTSTIGIHTSQAGQENRGYWITPKMESQNILDKYTALVKKFNPMITPEDKIIVKYRTEDNTLLENAVEVDSSPESITWVDSGTFTSTSDLSNVVVGNEVEFISGVGAGYLAHITSISEDEGTYTISIDETVHGVSEDDRAVAIFANWVKLGTVTTDSESNDYGYEKFRVDQNAKWIQFKFELRGEEITVEEILVDNQNHLPVFDQGQQR